MRVAVDPDLLHDIRRMLARLERAMEGRVEWAGYPMAHELNGEIADAIEGWTRSRLGEMVPEGGIQAFARTLVDLYQDISDAETVEVTTDPRSIVVKVRGCRDFEECRLRKVGSKYSGCLPDMIVAAILQRAMDTPVKVEVTGGDEWCARRFTPAWLVDLLVDLDRMGADGVVVVHNDRILFSHLPTEAQAEALSESVLINEESPEVAPPRSPVFRRMTHRDVRIMLLRFDRVFVSICLRPEADEDRMRAHIAGAIKATFRGA